MYLFIQTHHSVVHFFLCSINLTMNGNGIRYCCCYWFIKYRLVGLYIFGYMNLYARYIWAGGWGGMHTPVWQDDYRGMHGVKAPVGLSVAGEFLPTRLLPVGVIIHLAFLDWPIQSFLLLYLYVLVFHKPNPFLLLF